MDKVNYYKQELKRAAWRLQYRVKKQRKELTMESFTTPFQPSFTDKIDNKIFLEGCFQQLKSSVGKTILKEIYINDKKEKDIAEELKISQQAVSKWKKKMIQELCHMNNF